MKRSKNEFAIIVVYVDDINIVGTPNELIKAIDCLKKEFDMQDLGRTKFCLGLQIEYLNKGVLVYGQKHLCLNAQFLIPNKTLSFQWWGGH